MALKDQAAILRIWAELAPKVDSDHTWVPVRAMIDAAKLQARELGSQLEALLDKSDDALRPLCDPLRAEIGVHRRSRGEREESYSDWLEWTLAHIDKAEEVLRVLGIVDEAFVELLRDVPFQVSREEVIPGGRLDKDGWQQHFSIGWWDKTFKVGVSLYFRDQLRAAPSLNALPPRSAESKGTMSFGKDNKNAWIQQPLMPEDMLVLDDLMREVIRYWMELWRNAGGLRS